VPPFGDGRMRPQTSAGACHPIMAGVRGSGDDYLRNSIIDGRRPRPLIAAFSLQGLGNGSRLSPERPAPTAIDIHEGAGSVQALVGIGTSRGSLPKVLP
jgi:hypothetical protein